MNCTPILKALADQTRWKIVRELLDETLTVTELTERVHATQYNVSKHLRILREAGIIHTEKQGKHLKCSVENVFRLQVTKDKKQLNVGCCTFKFD
ncbi:MAG TPA: metalloregulator ArsR/SmtB family transcription factor [Candidatus Limnocylindria bacterium]|nr:metalloregulator ArsR/SmtB family transcription factor [Candidatus Limnocylindria bacterium]